MVDPTDLTKAIAHFNRIKNDKSIEEMVERALVQVHDKYATADPPNMVLADESMWKLNDYMQWAGITTHTGKVNYVLIEKYVDILTKHRKYVNDRIEEKSDLGLQYSPERDTPDVNLWPGMSINMTGFFSVHKIEDIDVDKLPVPDREMYHRMNGYMNKAVGSELNGGGVKCSLYSSFERKSLDE